MKSSAHPILQRASVIVLSAGHGDGDPGACYRDPASGVLYEEARQACYMVDVMAQTLRGQGLQVDVVPCVLGLGDTIRWINERYAAGSAWALEVHRDSAEGLSADDASHRCGIYTGNSSQARDVGKDWAASMRFGAIQPWNRTHTASPRKSLAFVTRPRCLSMILELGFMQGRNDQPHLRKLAECAALACAEVFT